MAELPPSIIVKLGKASKKKIKALERGSGPLADEIAQAVEAVREQLGDEARGMTLAPVVLIYKRKEKKGSLLPFLGL